LPRDSVPNGSDIPPQDFASRTRQPNQMSVRAIEARNPLVVDGSAIMESSLVVDFDQHLIVL
jgi:hypothetical protein